MFRCSFCIEMSELVSRRLSRAVAGALDFGQNPALGAAIVKDLGAVFEQEIPEIARLLLQIEPSVCRAFGMSRRTRMLDGGHAVLFVAWRYARDISAA